MKVIIDPGLMPVDWMSDLYAKATNDVCFVTDRFALRDEYLRRCDTCQIDVYQEILLATPESTDATALWADTLKIWWALMDDHQTFMLCDRAFKMPISNSLMASKILDHVLCSQKYFERTKPDALVYMAMPHNSMTWVFAKVAQEMGVRVLFFQETLLPWRFALMEGLRRESTLFYPQRRRLNAGEAALAVDFERRKRGSFAEAFPIYERARLSRNNGKFYNFFRDVRRSWRRPDLVLNKALCYRTYGSLWQSPNKEERYAAFFLHFQPERTTLPESYGFGQQLGAIVALAATLPAGMRLYVKEHPSMYTADCHWFERRPFWYRRLAQVPNVILLPLDTDPYALIDGSECVATVAGTIGGEALIRGKAVVAFGRGALTLVRTPALHKYTDQASLKQFMAELGQIKEAAFTLEQYCADIASETYSGARGETRFEEIEPRQHTEDVRFAALADAYAELMGVPDGAPAAECKATMQIQ